MIRKMTNLDVAKMEKVKEGERMNEQLQNACLRV